MIFLTNVLIALQCLSKPTIVTMMNSEVEAISFVIPDRITSHETNDNTHSNKSQWKNCNLNQMWHQNYLNFNKCFLFYQIKWKSQ